MSWCTWHVRTPICQILETSELIRLIFVCVALVACINCLSLTVIRAHVGTPFHFIGTASSVWLKFCEWFWVWSVCFFFSDSAGCFFSVHDVRASIFYFSILAELTCSLAVNRTQIISESVGTWLLLFFCTHVLSLTERYHETWFSLWQRHLWFEWIFLWSSWGLG